MVRPRAESSGAGPLQFLEVLEDASLGVLVTSAAGHVVWLNLAQERRFHLSREEVIGRPRDACLRTLMAPHLAEPARFLREALHAPTGRRLNVKLTVSGTTTWLRYWRWPLSAGAWAGGCIDHFADVTESRKALERARATRRLQVVDVGCTSVRASGK
jgi:PAS domain-containing protein